MTHQAPNPGEASYDLEDPHGFHKDAEGHDAHHQHHVSGWKLQVGILLLLLFFTLLTVNVAQAESFLMGYGFPITQLWNVILAMVIATIKAMLVCMYFMHLKHDNPLNTFVLLFTIATFGLFLLFPSIDTGSRGYVNPFKTEVLSAGGTGHGMIRKNGVNISGPIVAQARQEAIDKKAAYYAEKHGHDEPTDADIAEAAEYIWFHLYDAKAEHSHHKPVTPTFDDAPDDDGVTWHDRWMAAGGPARVHGKHGGDHAGDHGETHAVDHDAAPVSTANHARPRHGLTPGLFDDHAHGEHHDDAHDQDHGDGHDDH